MTPFKAPFDPFDKGYPIRAEDVTDQELVGVLGMALYGCAYWCPDIRVEGREAVPARLTPAQASALRDDASDTTEPCTEELPLLGAAWVFIPNAEADMPEVRLSIPRLREAVAQTYRSEAARGRLDLGDFGPPSLDAVQSDIAVQLALFGKVVFG